MRNLKRVLSLALALVMVLGMMVITTSAADFTDAEEITYTEAVDVASAIGVINGDNGKFYPNRILTREEGATLICYLLMGKNKADKLAGTGSFTDVAADRWSAGAIDYCVALGFIGGNGDGTFTPKGELTGIAYGKLLLCALGYDAAIEGYGGTNWATNIILDMMTAGLMVDGVNPAAPLTREVAAQMTLQALQANMVTYQYKGTTITVNGVDIVTGASAATVTKDTLMSVYYKNLKKVSGVINQIGAASVKLGNTTFTGASAEFEQIGYQAYTWTLDGQKENVSTKTAVTDIYVTGESLGTSTNGAAFAKLTNPKDDAYVAECDTEYDVYLNGVKQSAAKEAAALAKADKVGVKVDFVDNDNAGKAEAVVITEYTYTTVTSVVKKSVSGEVSVAYYELANGVDIDADELVCADELGRGDYITYVKYVDKTGKQNADVYYVTVLAEAEGEFDSITREKLNDETVKVYTIAGEDYIASELDNADVTFLKASNINEDIVYVVDQYGYLVYAGEPAAAADDYLYVIDNEHDRVLTGLAETLVAYADGSVEIVDVKQNVTDSQLAKEIYSYTVKNDAYTLKDKNAVKLDVDAYTTKSLKMYYNNGSDSVTLTTGTTIVDLRDYLAGDADEGTVYVGYKEIPSFTDGTIYYLASAKLGFLIAGEDPAAAGKAVSFVVFDTDTNVVDKDKGVYTYELEEGVLVAGELKTNYVLSQAQKDSIDAHGVGVYEFAKDGSLAKYTSFDRDDVIWTPESSGSLIKNDTDITDDYTAIFLNITDGEINEWEEYVEEGEYYAYFDKDNDVIYIVADAVKGNTIRCKVAEAEVVTANGNKVYYVAEGKVTRTTNGTASDVLAAGGNIALAEDVELTTPVVVAEGATTVIDGQGNTMTGDANGRFFNGDRSENNMDGIGKDSKLVFKNIHFVGDPNGGQTGYAVIVGPSEAGVAEIVFENCTFENMWCAVYGGSVEATADVEITIEGCTYINTKWGYSVNTGYEGNYTVTFEDNTGDYTAESELFGN